MPRGHLCYGIDYDNVYALAADINVHGGLTFAARCAESGDEHDICHIVEPGDDDDVWWFGFDCAHCGDMLPSLPFERRYEISPFLPSMPPDVYCTARWVEGECEDLAASLDRAAGA